MDTFQKKALFLLRVSLGWMMFYAGITKVLNPEWSAAGYLENATTFSGLFAWLGSPGILPVTNFLNEWGLTLLGISLIFGIFVRLSSLLGVLLMLLYYLPVLDFPKVGGYSYLVDDHVIYAFSLLVLAAMRAGRFYGFDQKIAESKYMKKHKKLNCWTT